MFCIPITEHSQVAAARRAAIHLARQAGLNDTDTGRAALVATEAATNLVKHASSGQLLMRSLDGAGIELLALDRGPGMRFIGECLRDGYSTTGSLGIGLGAITRLAAMWDIYSVPGKGTALLAWVREGQRSGALPAPESGRVPTLEIGAICWPMPGEDVSGDAWACELRPGRGLLVVADGLGHGPGAAEAAQLAVQVVRAHPTGEPTALLGLMHGALRHTRGAAVAVVEVDLGRQQVTFAGVGNIAGTLITAAKPHPFISQNGIVGHHVRKIQAVNAPWTAEAILILHSDGLAGRWNLGAYPGLNTRHASLIAGVLYRDFTRGRDDVTVLVVKQQSGSR